MELKHQRLLGEFAEKNELVASYLEYIRAMEAIKEKREEDEDLKQLLAAICQDRRASEEENDDVVN